MSTQIPPSVTIPARPSLRLLAGVAAGCVAAAAILLGPVPGAHPTAKSAGAAPAQDGDPYYRHVDTWVMPPADWNDGVLPAAIAQDAAGQLYVADVATAHVLVLAPDGTVVKELAAPDSSDGVTGHIPMAIAVDDMRQQVHVVWVAYQSLAEWYVPVSVMISLFTAEDELRGVIVFGGHHDLV